MKKEIVIGVDEVGRGCIAGDLLVCAYALKPEISDEDIEALRGVAMDSKAFSSRKKRAATLPVVEAMGLATFARRSPDEIAASNIRVATLEAMREAAHALRSMLGGSVSTRVIVDGRDVPPGIAEPVEALIKGDAKVMEISCASVLAKVRRDTEMERAAEIYPGYGFEAHAGYGTRQHQDAIARLGLCDIHRDWAEKFLVK